MAIELKVSAHFSIINIDYQKILAKASLKSNDVKEIIIYCLLEENIIF